MKGAMIRLMYPHDSHIHGLREREREREREFHVSSRCRVAIVFCVSSFAVPWVGHWSVIEAVPGHTHLLSETYTVGPSLTYTPYPRYFS